MEDFVKRLKTEKEELEEKLKKLKTFLMTREFFNLTALQQMLLIKQEEAMRDYLDILYIRYALLTQGDKENA